jgi:hypothetical protein
VAPGSGQGDQAFEQLPQDILPNSALLQLCTCTHKVILNKTKKPKKIEGGRGNRGGEDRGGWREENKYTKREMSCIDIFLTSITRKIVGK